MLWFGWRVSWGRGNGQGLLPGSVCFQVLVPIEVLVGECEGVLLYLFCISSRAGDLTLVGVFTVTCETVLIELSGLVPLVAVQLQVGSVMALEFGVKGFCVRRTWIGCVSGTLAFFFRLRPFPPRLPLFVFLSRTLFFFFPVVGAVRVTKPGDAHRGRTPTEAV